MCLELFRVRCRALGFGGGLAGLEFFGLLLGLML